VNVGDWRTGDCLFDRRSDLVAHQFGGEWIH
jgi:hypothetical protein